MGRPVSNGSGGRGLTPISRGKRDPPALGPGAELPAQSCGPHKDDPPIDDPSSTSIGVSTDSRARPVESRHNSGLPPAYAYPLRLWGEAASPPVVSLVTNLAFVTSYQRARM